MVANCSKELRHLLNTVKDADLMAAQKKLVEDKRRELLAANKAAARALLSQVSEVSYVSRITRDSIA